jgi:hypothetical protein
VTVEIGAGLHQAVKLGRDAVTRNQIGPHQDFYRRLAFFGIDQLI